ncbi:MAG: type II toxin-antitoxin system VapC family toxin [Magnetococcales bacterium]|nr:type II toxin-antitoxin system VapC family toxin [Magnetococcales bacterium]
MRIVLDASALLAFLHGERGAEMVAANLEGAWISSVNWSEVLQKSMEHGVNTDGLSEDWAELGVMVQPFLIEDALRMARYWLRSRALGLSFADRACLALGARSGGVVVTADRAWIDLIGTDYPVIQLIR